MTQNPNYKEKQMTYRLISTLLAAVASTSIILAGWMLINCSLENNPHDPQDGRPYLVGENWGELRLYPEPTTNPS